MRKHNVDEINLKINEVQFFERNGKKVLNFQWSSDIGFGWYSIIGIKDDLYPGSIRWLVQSECMDSEEDRAFGRKLLEIWHNEMFIIE